MEVSIVRHLVPVLFIASAATLVSASVGAAQGSSDPHRVFAARAALETQAALAEGVAAAPATAPALRESKRAEAFMLRQRLQSGDFLVGDRIVVSVAGEPTLTDTAVVRAGTVIQLGKLPAISLNGVLRSELEDHVTRELTRYIREPRVLAIPLLRVAVLGQVGQPGYMHVPADMLLSDLLMRAGGPADNADLRKAELRRGTEQLLSARNVQTALADGISLDDLHVRSGDEFNIPEKRNTSWTSVMQAAAVVTGLLSVAFTLSR
jgi:protein involved in polysaccharide export with SLBB domain